MANQAINKKDLTVGMYVDLNLSWFDHPFASSKFVIKDEATLRKVKGLKKLTKCTWDPAKSQMGAPSPDESFKPVAEAAPTPKPEPAVVEIDQAAQDKLAELKAKRQRVNAVESKVRDVTKKIRNLLPNLTSGQKEALEAATELADEVTEDLARDTDSVMHMINNKAPDQNYFTTHAINVAALSVMLARALNIQEREVRQIGIGAFLHDVGCTRLPGKILAKKEALTGPEKAVYNTHAEIGAKLLDDTLSRVAFNIVQHHHENMDGTGFPKGLKGGEIPPEAQIVAIANRYDNLCNPRSGNGLTPTDAIRKMFREERTRFNPSFLDKFIRALGIYPPGTLILLNDKRPAIVVQANPNKPLKPTVVIYEPTVPRDEAIPVDLSEHDDITIEQSVTLRELSDEIGAYLSQSARIHYYLMGAAGDDIINAGRQIENTVTEA